MPLYEYECESCGNRFEIIQRFSDQPLTSCQQCGGTLRKLLSAPAIQFKGSGWYVTDYARKGGTGGGDHAPSPKSTAGSSDKPAAESPAATAAAATGAAAGSGGTGGAGSTGGGNASGKD